MGIKLTVLLSLCFRRSIDDNDFCKSDDERLWSFSLTILRILDSGCSVDDKVDVDGLERFVDNDGRKLLIISFNSLTVFFNWVFSRTRASI